MENPITIIEIDDQFEEYSAGVVDDFIHAGFKGLTYDSALWFTDLLKNRLEYLKQNSTERFIPSTIF